MKCIFCSTELGPPIHKNLHECPGCGNRRIAPADIPSKDNAWRQNRSFMLRASSNKAKEAARLKDAHEGQLDLLEQYVKPGAVYDVGAAGGFFMKAARDRGWQVAGNELSASSVAWAKRAYDLDIDCCYLEDAGLPDGAFDAVVMWNVLEHVVDPVLTLRECHRILKPGGCILVKVPTKNAAELRRHFEWKHFTEFSRNGLDHVLKQAGFVRLVLERSAADKVSHTIALYRKPA